MPFKCNLQRYNAAEAKGATDFFAWKRVDPDCRVGDAQALHTANAIKKATLVMEPYPHVQVFNIFPNGLYACIMQKMPPGDQAYKRLKEGVDRFMVDLYDRKKAAKGKADKSWDVMDGKGGFDADFWRKFGEVYATNDWIRDAWLVRRRL